MTTTYRRHPLDKRRPAPHLAPRSPKRRRREQRTDHVLALFTQTLQHIVGATHVCQDDFALAPPPYPRQENHS